MAWRSILKPLKPYRFYCVIGPLCKLAEAVLELYLPLMMAQLIDRGVVGGDTAYILHQGGLMLLIVTIGLCCALVCQYVASVTSQGYGTQLRNTLFTHMQTLSHRELDAIGTSSLINRITSDVNQLQYAVAMLIRLVIRAPFLCIGGIVMAILIDAKLALIVICLIPLLVLIITLVMRRTIPLNRRVQQKLDHLTLVLRENLSGVRVIRAFCRTQPEQERFSDAVEEHTDASIRVGKVSTLLNPLTQLLMNLGILSIVWFGGFRVESGDLTTGEIVALINYINQILLALTVVANLVISYSRAYASAGRISEILTTTSSVTDPIEVSASAAGEHPVIEFDHVGFSYHEGGDEALTDVSFSVQKGQTVGIIGGTGSGKTTLIHLLPRFYDVTTGSIRINGVDIRAIPQQQLREQMGIVLQKVELFSGSIADNIRWGAPQASDDEVRRAAVLAQADSFIQQKPEGYQAPVERGGANLSGGQRQRLAIARALVRQPEILVLDDASSALDYATEAALRRAIHEGCPDTTVLTVSQRISTICHADLILVLDDGMLMGCGTHDELLASCETYREIARLQEGGDRS